MVGGKCSCCADLEKVLGSYIGFLCCTYFVALESVVKHWLVGSRFGGNSVEVKFDTFLERWEFVFLAE